MERESNRLLEVFQQRRREEEKGKPSPQPTNCSVGTLLSIAMQQGIGYGAGLCCPPSPCKLLNRNHAFCSHCTTALALENIYVFFTQRGEGKKFYTKGGKEKTYFYVFWNNFFLCFLCPKLQLFFEKKLWRMLFRFFSKKSFGECLSRSWRLSNQKP